MATLGPVLRGLRDLLAGKDDASDRELLQRYAESGDGEAFAALVRRHGPMIQGVCRRVLGSDPLADDVFQATFLVLARKAGSVFWRESIGNWLYGVAYRLARRARVDAARRRRHEQAAALRPDAAVRPEVAELCQLLDEELSQLAEKYRMPLLLCCLQDQTVDEAAQQLGWSFGQVKGRLQRGRELLRERLRRRGIVLSAGVLAGILSESVVRAAPAALTAAALQSASGGPVSAGVANLVKGAMQAMFWTKMKWVLLVVLTLGLVGGAAALLLPEETARGVPAPEDTKAVEMDVGKPLPLPLLELHRWAGNRDNRVLPMVTVCRGPRHLLPASVPSPYLVTTNRQPDMINAFLDPASKQESPTGDRPSLVYLVGPPLNSGERWCPVALYRNGNQFTLEVESWTDDGPRDKNIRAQDVYLLSLGVLPAGQYTLSVQWKGYFYSLNRDKSTGLEQYAWTSYQQAKLPFEVDVNPTDRVPSTARFIKAALPQQALAEYRQMPSYHLLNVLPGGNLNGFPKFGLRVGSFDLANWLAGKPTNLGDFAALCQNLLPAKSGSQTYGVILGGNGMVLREVIWRGQTVRLRVEAWPPTKPTGSYSVLIANLGDANFPPPRQTPYEVAVDWVRLGPDGVDEAKSQEMSRTAISRETIFIK